MAKQARRPGAHHNQDTQPASAPPQPTPARYEPPRRSTYVEAVGLYEQALRTLQQHNFAKAADLLQHMVTSFPEERELIERSRVYLALCERQLKPLTADPQNTAERLYAATIALNAGKPDEAVGHLERILQEDAHHDQALYMLAVSHAQRDATPDAIRYLQQAIEANPENRALARMDPDLDDLRDDDAVSALLDAPSVMRTSDPKRHPRRR